MFRCLMDGAILERGGMIRGAWRMRWAPSSTMIAALEHTRKRFASSAHIGENRGMQTLLTADDVAATLGVRPATVHLMARRGDLPCVRVHRRSLRFEEADVAAFIAKRRSGASPPPQPAPEPKVVSRKFLDLPSERK